MKKIIRQLQTHFPYLHDLRFHVTAHNIMIRKKPIDTDFGAMRFFNPKPSEVFIDVGANRGLTVNSILIYKQFQNQIFAFEPNPLVFDKLLKNPYIEGNTRVACHNVALGSAQDEKLLYVPFYRKWMYDGLSSFDEDSPKEWLKKNFRHFNPKLFSIKTRKCKIDKLDAYDYNPYFIKIDVEGHELSVLKGAEITLRKNEPIILLESMTSQINHFLSELGYDFFAYEENILKRGIGKVNTYCITESRYRELQR